MSESALTLTELRRIYAPIFPGANLHHMVPTSRNGGGSEFNLFPYDKRTHGSYHDVLWNLKVDEVWSLLDGIHHSIFESDEDYIKPWWYAFCDLDKGTLRQRELFTKDKINALEKPLSTDVLSRRWERAFGGQDLSTARGFMKIMLLFMVFGVKITDRDTLFNNGNLVKFIEKSPCTRYRLWAFQTIFGDGGSVQAMKTKIAKILNKNPFYSP